VRARTPKVPDAAALAEIEAVLFRPMGLAGVRARTGLYEGVLEALSAWIGTLRPEGAEVFRFPPVMSRAHLERSGYLKSFPNLLGCVCCLAGSEREITGVVGRFVEGQGDWTEALAPADLVLTPASCYPIYPIAAERGRAPAAGLTFDVGCDCFRREPSADLDRLQSFRMREFVRIGSAEQVAAFRQAWLDQADRLADTLGLPYRLDVANDPFFGRGGPLLAASQREQSLKFELLVPVISDEKPTACMSFNYHQDLFGRTWDLALADGAPAHTACVAFGMDRLALALFVHHGLDAAQWPASVRAALQL
jgi:seryl-tRNA synthetase